MLNMRQIITSSSHRKYVLSAFLFAIVIIGLFACYKIAFAAPLTNVSPNPNDVSSGGVAGGVSHLLKKETVAHVETLRLAAYYPAGDTSDKKLKINYGVDGKKCLISNIKGDGTVVGYPNQNTNGHFYNNNATVKVTITGVGQKVYDVPIKNVCNNDTNRNNTQGAGWLNNDFFANYDFPGSIPLDPGGTGLYKADITIEYTSAVNEGPSDSNSVNFTASVNGGNAMLGPLGRQSARDFGIRSAYFRNGNRDVQAATQFGLPCDVSSTTFSARLYDPDVNVFGTTYMWVTENGTRLTKSKYDNATNDPGNFVQWDAGSQAWASTGNSGVVSEIFINGADKGRKYEFHILNPRNDGTPANQTANVLSIGIPYDTVYAADDFCSYKLRPTLSQSPEMYSFYPNQEVVASIVKTGRGPILESHPWEIYAVRYPSEPATRLLTDSYTAADPCTVVPSGASSCNKIDDAAYIANPGRSFVDNGGGPDAVSTRLCYFARIKDPTESNQDNNLWSYSDMDCAISSKSPKVQILGSDLKVRGAISTSASITRAPDGSTKTFGSWVEYGVFSTGTNRIASSGAGLKDGSTNNLAARAAWSRLTFSNKVNQPTDSYGSYTPLSSSTAPELFAGLTATPGPVNLANSGVYDVGNATLGGSTNIDIPAGMKGKYLILRGDNVTIDGNTIVDNSGRSGVRDISQIVILANTINIRNNVTNIDAWLLTRDGGSLNTCSDVAPAASLTVNDCNNSLTVNGAVMTSHLYLRRTAGAGAADPQTAAEVFRLRPDSQLWAYAFANRADRAQTVYVTELPPRF